MGTAEYGATYYRFDCIFQLINKRKAYFISLFQSSINDKSFHAYYNFPRNRKVFLGYNRFNSKDKASLKSRERQKSQSAHIM